MKLYIRQQVLTLADRFSVKDEAGRDCYYVEGDFFSIGKRLHIYDSEHWEAAWIQQKVWSFKPRYLVYCGGRQVAEIVREITLLQPRYTVSGLDWTVTGSFWEHDYEISANGYPVAAIRKEWMTWGDSYALEISRPENALCALAVVLAIDCATAAQQTHNI